MSRKQPFRNALLKTLKEREELKQKMFEAEELMAEAESVAEEAEHHYTEAVERHSQLDKQEEKLEHKERMLKDEFNHINKYHPANNYTVWKDATTLSVDIDYAFQQRFFGPMVDWDDFNDRGVVKLAYKDPKAPNNPMPKYMAYQVSGGALKDFGGMIREDMVEHYSKLIARDLIYAMMGAFDHPGIPSHPMPPKHFYYKK